MAGQHRRRHPAVGIRRQCRHRCPRDRRRRWRHGRRPVRRDRRPARRRSSAHRRLHRRIDRAAGVARCSPRRAARRAASDNARRSAGMWQRWSIAGGLAVLAVLGAALFDVVENANLRAGLDALRSEFPDPSFPVTTVADSPWALASFAAGTKFALLGLAIVVLVSMAATWVATGFHHLRRVARCRCRPGFPRSGRRPPARSASAAREAVSDRPPSASERCRSSTSAAYFHVPVTSPQCPAAATWQPVGRWPSSRPTPPNRPPVRTRGGRPTDRRR